MSKSGLVTVYGLVSHREVAVSAGFGTSIVYLIRESSKIKSVSETSQDNPADALKLIYRAFHDSSIKIWR